MMMLVAVLIALAIIHALGARALWRAQDAAAHIIGLGWRDRAAALLWLPLLLWSLALSFALWLWDRRPIG